MLYITNLLDRTKYFLTSIRLADTEKTMKE